MEELKKKKQNELHFHCKNLTGMKKQEIILEAIRMQKTHNKVKEELFALNLPLTGYKDGKVINTYRDGTVTEVVYLSDNSRIEKKLNSEWSL